MCERLDLESALDKKLFNGSLSPSRWIEEKRKEIEKEIRQQRTPASRLKTVKSTR